MIIRSISFMILSIFIPVYLFAEISVSGNLKEALKLYQDQSYRRSDDILKKVENQSFFKKYLSARNSEEVYQYHRALKYYRMISVLDFKIFENEEMKRFFLENYLYHYLLMQIKTSGNVDETMEIFNQLPADSVYYQKSVNIIFEYLWGKEEYRQIKKITPMGKENYIYQLCADIMTGNISSIKQLFDSLGQNVPEEPVKDVFEKLYPQHYRLLLEFEPGFLFEQSLKYENRDFSLYILTNYLNSDSDFEYYRMQFLNAEGKTTEMCREMRGMLKQDIENTKILNLYINTMMYRRRAYNSLYADFNNILKNSREKYQNIYVRVLDYTGKHDEMADWLLENPEQIRKYDLRVAQAYLKKGRLNDILNFVENAGVEKISEDVLLISSLILLEKGETAEGFQQWLILWKNYPGSYAGITAAEYIREYRIDHPDLYEKFTEQVRKDSFSGNLTEKELIWVKLEFPHIYQILPKKIIQGLNRDSLVPRWDKIKKPDPEIIQLAESPVYRYFNLEFYDYYLTPKIEKAPERLEATVQYGEVMREIKLYGNYISALHSLISYRWLDQKEDIYFLPREILEKMFPDDDFDLIQKETDNTNLTFWILSAFREESHFRKQAFSHAGAYGYSQLMPYISEILAGRMGHPEYHYYDFQDNIQMGIYLYQVLHRKYRKIPMHYLAAYNGGEPAVNRWKRSYPYQSALWIDCIPYSETRNYVKKITVTDYYYRRLYSFE